ncbi:hypothetical protein M0D68_14435 [Paraburkholderia sp. SEWSISQ10-3 4]|uniref:hypothetical protein n=1 Tax=Paraburkholderia TaxID=1822464 RepID=UPI002252C28B|nr:MULTISPECIES: hypothetical protein [Paraburkholderia]MCX4139390.1 hypothetical protein [Paraburkholderia aspalathi]MDN7172077.1 hypothetical protein [Paraburkholderia sp. SEWSISQ10-3 4]MDQ6501716.1 hypothetical protein [Paraburkholderia aspalathi]
MTAHAYRDFESARRASQALGETKGENWIKVRRRPEPTQEIFTSHFRVGHAAEKALVVEFKRSSAEFSIRAKRISAEGEIGKHRFARDEQVKVVFEQLRDLWKRETQYVSSNSDLVLNENYQKIIGLGPQAVPWIIDDLRETSAQWFWALRVITRNDPVPQRDRGRVRRMVDAWLNWAGENGIE